MASFSKDIAYHFDDMLLVGAIGPHPTAGQNYAYGNQ